jgi:hypothetical protein
MHDEWLKRRMTLAEVVEFLSKLPIRDPHQVVAQFEDWYKECFRPGDDLWWYDMGGWLEMAGENGLAIVRAGETAFMYPLTRS